MSDETKIWACGLIIMVLAAIYCSGCGCVPTPIQQGCKTSDGPWVGEWSCVCR